MIRLAIRRVRPDRVEALREWFKILETDRRDEALATLADETVTHETALLITEGDQPILVYALEVEDPEVAMASVGSGKHPIDAEHRALLDSVLGDFVEHVTVFDLAP